LPSDMFAGCLLFARETGRIGRGNSECGVVSERPKAGGLRQSLAMGERISGGGDTVCNQKGQQQWQRLVACGLVEGGWEDEG
jgi:hypothetical protein